ncbi:MAG: hypothetical protein ACPGSK_03505 [Alphaproteobacteria bacterium]
MTVETPPHRQTLYTTDQSGETRLLELTPKRRYPERFLTMFPNAMEGLAAMDRPPSYYRTLMHLCAVADAKQFRKITAREIAEATNQSLPSVDRAMAMLQADRVIITSGRGVGKTIRLNSRLAWMSSAEKRARQMADSPDPELEDARGR